METATQLTLPLSDNPPFADLLIQCKANRVLTIKLSNRFKRGWQVKIPAKPGGRELTIPSFLANAPVDIKSALIEWALLPCRDVRRETRDRKRTLEKIIFSHIDSRSPTHRKHRRFDAEQAGSASKGTRYDLREVFETINTACFHGRLHSLVHWGRTHSIISSHRKKTDSNGHYVNLIIIAGIYNRPDIPRFAIEAIMHHEMLHIVFPPESKNGRNIIHGTAFRNFEKQFIHYAAWRTWEKTILPRLVQKKIRSI